MTITITMEITTTIAMTKTITITIEITTMITMTKTITMEITTTITTTKTIMMTMTKTSNDDGVSVGGRGGEDGGNGFGVKVKMIVVVFIVGWWS